MRNATPARDTRSTRGTVDTRLSFGSFKCPSSERNSFRGGSFDGDLERAFLGKIDENCFLRVHGKKIVRPYVKIFLRYHVLISTLM